YSNLLSLLLFFSNIRYDLFSLEITCNSPRISNGSFRPQRTLYHDGDLIRILCDSGFTFEPDNGEKVVECTRNGWSPSPKCVTLGGKCGLPPVVENGDILDSPKPIYFPSETVTYQCQNFYTMEGSPRVTCQNGHWSQPPTCRVACTANEEDMRVRNIKLRWSNRDKIYSEDGTTVEFVCLRGYKPHPNTRSLRANCVDGKFDYPDSMEEKHYGDRGNT
uniref:Sushi domain-containing protein n=1 Tax=Pseudonaja textilis TaxID=8673 RepID=A0A670Y8S2_PSETE